MIFVQWCIQFCIYTLVLKLEGLTLGLSHNNNNNNKQTNKHREHWKKKQDRFHLLQNFWAILLLDWSQSHLVHVPERQWQALEAASHAQLGLHLAEEEVAVNLSHLEEEGEYVEEGGTGQEVGEVLDLFNCGVDTSLLRKRECYVPAVMCMCVTVS